jgi:glycosyltransferase involved in cell wall biosynthesis
MYKHFSLSKTNYLDRVFALSPSIKKIYSHNGIKSNLIDIIPNFYDPKFSCDKNKNIDLLESEFTLLYVGRLREEKGVDILIDAITSINGQNIVVNIVGDGPQQEELVRRMKRNGISNSIKFHGEVDHSILPLFYRQSDLFIHPGRWPEPFGRTILEALQHECPPIVSDIGAPPWIIAEAGRTFERESAADLAKKIVSCSSESELSQLKQNCQSRLDEFTPGSIITRIESTYEELFVP